MRNLEKAEKLLQEAYNFDIGKRTEPVDLTAFNDIGSQTLHIAYYDSGLAANEEIQKHLAEFPNGTLASLIIRLRDTRLGEYPIDTLNKMYGLSGGKSAH